MHTYVCLSYTHPWNIVVLWHLVCVFVLYLRLPPGVPQIVDDVSEGRRLAELNDSTGDQEEAGEQEVVVEWLHGHRGDRAWILFFLGIYYIYYVHIKYKKK